jgi:hypothetical protein
MQTYDGGMGFEGVSEGPPVFLNARVIEALRIQVAILGVRSRPRSSEELEPLFSLIETLLRDLVREAGAA